MAHYCLRNSVPKVFMATLIHVLRLNLKEFDRRERREVMGETMRVSVTKRSQMPFCARLVGAPGAKRLQRSVPPEPTSAVKFGLYRFRLAGVRLFPKQ